MSESESSSQDWEDRADELQKHGVPRQRARVVALRERDHSYSEIASTLGFGSDNEDRSQVQRHLDAYREERDNARWLLENAPEL